MTTVAAAAPAAASPSTNALTSLTNNFNSFLNLLLTQLQNQDPSSPMDTNQFTTELVQMSSVEQQITTNSSLTQLIQATQGMEMIQGSALTGQTVSVTSPQMPLQSGSGSIKFTTAAAGPVAIQVTDSSGTDVKDATLTSSAGPNTWTWNGVDNAGTQLPDGAYTVTVKTAGAGTATTIPFSVTGTATGVTTTGGAVNLQLGAVSVPFSAVTAVGQ